MKGNRLIPVLGVMLIVTVGTGMALKAVLPAEGSPRIIIGNKSAKGNAIDHTSVSGITLASEAAVDLEADSVTYEGILRSIDTNNKKIGIYIPENYQEKIFSYDTITDVKTANNVDTVMESLPLGSVIKCKAVSKKDDLLLSVIESSDAWDYTNVRNLEIESSKLMMKIGDRNFSYDAGISVFSGLDQISLDDIDTTKDILDIKGTGSRILSIRVTRGHGILDFSNYDDFLGGNIEIGYQVFDMITDNMKYSLPEGTYKVRMTNGGLVVNKVVTVERNRTAMLDLSKYTSQMTKKSIVRFNVAPAEAILYIDGGGVDSSYPQTLEYGEYLVKAVADGYKTYDTIVRINRPKQEINISLVPTDEEGKDSVTSQAAVSSKDNTAKNSVSENEGNIEEDELTDTDETETANTTPVKTTTTTAEPHKTETVESKDNEETTPTAPIPVKTDEKNKITLRNPVGATAYLDGTKIGTVPCETTKVTGEHVIMLSKDGYVSQNYTVDIEDDNQDTIFSFPELNKE